MILVTGASGFIGGKLAEKLVQMGNHVRCQYRREEPPRHLLELEKRGAELFQWDLTESTDSASLLKDIDTVFHVAALASDWGSYELFHKANVQATENLLQQGKKQGVKKCIALSSISVHGFGTHKNSTEEGPYYEPISHYQKSKLHMEKVALSYNSEEMAVSVIRPGNVYGPGDRTTMYPIFDAMKKGYMGYLDRGKRLTCPVFIDDLIEAMILVWNNKQSDGEIFNITGGEEITWREILEKSSKELKIKPPKLNLPGSVASFFATILEFLFKLFRSPTAPPLTRYRVSQLTHDYHFSIKKAEQLLSYKPQVPFCEGIEKTVKAYLKK